MYIDFNIVVFTIMLLLGLFTYSYGLAADSQRLKQMIEEMEDQRK